MKKEFLLAVCMIVTCICLCTNDQNSLKACTKEATACSIKVKKEVVVYSTGYVEDEDASFNMFMNPLTQL